MKDERLRRRFSFFHENEDDDFQLLELRVKVVLLEKKLVLRITTKTLTRRPVIEPCH